MFNKVTLINPSMAADVWATVDESYTATFTDDFAESVKKARQFMAEAGDAVKSVTLSPHGFSCPDLDKSFEDSPEDTIEFELLDEDGNAI